MGNSLLNSYLIDGGRLLRRAKGMDLIKALPKTATQHVASVSVAYIVQFGVMVGINWQKKL